MVPESGLNPEQGYPQQPSAAPGTYGPQGYPPQPSGWPQGYPPQPFGAQGFSGPPGYPPQGFVAPAPAPPARPSPLPTEPRLYHEFYRSPNFRWWRPLAALGFFSVVIGVVTIVVTMPLAGIDLATGRSTLASLAANKVTPLLFTANNISLALAIPAAGLTQWLVFRQRPRWLSSIAGGFRWRLFWRFVLIAAPVLIALTVGGLTLGGEFSELAWNQDSLLLIVVIVTTTPFQAAGEEYAIRGLLVRSVASWFPWRAVGGVISGLVSAVVFMLLHGAGDPWLNAFYLLFGALSATLVWRTGGLEASVALHVCNNLVGEAVLPFTSIASIFDRGAGAAGPETLIQMAVVVLIAAGMLWQTSRLALPRATAPAANPQPVTH